eukprot:scaffold69923_cov45-Prasinocladus_malaysianus.AAC.2
MNAKQRPNLIAVIAFACHSLQVSNVKYDIRLFIPVSTRLSQIRPWLYGGPSCQCSADENVRPKEEKDKSLTYVC